jgi:ankyrin repeat protein
MLSQLQMPWGNVDIEGNTCLHYATIFGQPQCAFWLWASCHCDFGVLNGHQMSPLHFAVWRGDVKLMEFFIEQGCDVNAKNDQGLTPLHLAASRPVLSVVTKLLSHGADPTVRDGAGRFPADCAWDARLDLIQQVLLDYCSNR